VSRSLSAISRVTPQLLASAELSVDTPGEGFTDITREAAAFVAGAKAQDGALFLYLRHTSASLVIQENADPDVQHDLVTALRQIAPEDGGWIHTVEGPDDMPAHVKTMLTGVSLHIPVRDGHMALGTWQGIYLVEHRSSPHRRTVLLQFVGSGR
jgi:secondary thiamine-phosphate synthase enzyme